MCFDLRGQVIEAQRLQRLSLRPAVPVQVHGPPAETAAVTGGPASLSAGSAWHIWSAPYQVVQQGNSRSIQISASSVLMASNRCGSPSMLAY
jgi:hypothetical protein